MILFSSFAAEEEGLNADSQKRILLRTHGSQRSKTCSPLTENFRFPTLSRSNPPLPPRKSKRHV